MYDVIIVGAGPSGATLARYLQSSLRVLLIDRRDLLNPPSPTGLQKVCGGLIAPDAQKLLAHMNLGLPRDVLVDPQVFAVRSVDCRSGLERYYQRHYINVDREKLDRYLISLLGSHVTVRGSTRITGLVQSDGNVEVRGVSGNAEFAETGRILVGADGANSFVRKHLVDGGIPKSRQYVAVQDTYVVERPSPHFTVMFDPATTDFYSWAIPKNEELLVGSAVRPNRHAVKSHERTVAWMRNAGYELAQRTSRRSAYIERPRRGGDVHGGRGQTILIGEAAGLISPSSAEGLSYAFASALVAADVLDSGLNNVAQRYSHHLRMFRRSFRIKNAKGVVMYTPFLRRLVMKLGIAAMSVRTAEASR